jgi:uncharacterized membrane protein (DUF441 family)
MKDWKTTAAGVLTIVVTLGTAGLALLHGQPVNMTTTVAGITAGVGLIQAADSKPTKPAN